MFYVFDWIADSTKNLDLDKLEFPQTCQILLYSIYGMLTAQGSPTLPIWPDIQYADDDDQSKVR